MEAGEDCVQRAREWAVRKKDNKREWIVKYLKNYEVQGLHLFACFG